MAKQTYFKLINAAKTQLTKAGKDPEAIVYVLLERKQWTMTDFLVNQQQAMPLIEQRQLAADIKALLADEPPQYLVKRSWFYGLPFYVDSRVLIPRMDTEILISWVLTDYPDIKQLKVLDLGTGSGILGLTLKQQHPDWQVTLADISTDALAVAKLNAAKLKLDVTLVQSDMFANIAAKFDLIVSNPPYIGVQERDVMDASVLKYEPQIALFAENKGLAFYQHFFTTVSQYLKAQGRFYMEFGFRQKAALKALLQTELPTAGIAFHKDLAQKDRVLRGIINSGTNQ